MCVMQGFVFYIDPSWEVLSLLLRKSFSHRKFNKYYILIQQQEKLLEYREVKEIQRKFYLYQL